MLTAAKIDESRNAIQDGDSCGGDEVKFFNGVSEEVDGGEGRSIYIYIYFLIPFLYGKSSCSDFIFLNKIIVY